MYRMIVLHIFKKLGRIGNSWVSCRASVDVPVGLHGNPASYGMTREEPAGPPGRSGWLRASLRSWPMRLVSQDNELTAWSFPCCILGPRGDAPCGGAGTTLRRK